MIFFFLGLINSILFVHTDDRSVGRDLDNIHAIDITELFFLSQCRTCHTGFFFKFIKEVLERDRCKSLALTFYFYMLFCLDCLVQTIRVTASRHDTSGKLINDQYLIIFYNVILIAEHQVVCTQRKNHIVLDLKIFCICKVTDLEELLNLFHTLLCQADNLVLLIDKEITCFFLLDTHNSIHLGILRYILATFHLLC